MCEKCVHVSASGVKRRKRAVCPNPRKREIVRTYETYRPEPAPSMPYGRFAAIEVHRILSTLPLDVTPEQVETIRFLTMLGEGVNRILYRAPAEVIRLTALRAPKMTLSDAPKVLAAEVTGRDFRGPLCRRKKGAQSFYHMSCDSHTPVQGWMRRA